MAIDKLGAKAIITDFLSRYGLTYSSDVVSKWVGMISDSGQTVMPLIEEEIRQTDIFKQRFPGLATRTANGYNQISVEQYLQLENAYKATMRAAGLPPGFYDTPSDFAKFIGNDVSPTELENRISRGVLAARQAPQEIKDALTGFYGISQAESSLTAYMLDPDRALPVIEKQFQAAQVSGLGSAAGFNIGREDSERLVSLGVQSADQVQSGLGQANRSRGLGVETLAERGDDITDADLLGASFGVSAEAERRLRTRLAQRQAQFGGSSGGAGMSQSGSFLGGQR